ncbi:TatD-like deoxyribonuclease, putative [Plasmodium chabaudi adami]|uniref:TatD-like deoxyribonuclease, putative n=1 Tax=Plasmodium chabaudi adami TaxID=5826 RepID=A0A1D3LDX5_PLACE|nr:TatD-like deoxyribonuclease, putative [Plasmodium chabaudi adami]
MKFIFYSIKCVIILWYISDIFIKANVVKTIKNIRYFIPVKNNKTFKIKKKINLHNTKTIKMGEMDHSFIDIGSNLTDKMFDGIYNKKKHENDLRYVLNRAKYHNVEKIIITCTCIEDIDKSLNICETYDPKGEFLFLTAGVHPTNSYEFIDKSKIEENDMIAKNEFEEFLKYYKNEPNKQELTNLECDIKNQDLKVDKNTLNSDLYIPGFLYNEQDKNYLDKLKEKIEKHSNRIVCIGEMGLDFDRLHFCPKYVQIKYFIYQLKLVEMFKLPIFLHMRNCSDTFFEILEKYKPLIEQVGGVIHSFTDKEEIIQKITNYKNLYIGVNGCSLKTPENINAVKKIPMDLLLLETDAPWCSIKKSHASYHYIKDKYEKRNYTNLKKIKNILQCDDTVIFKDRNEPYNIVDIAEITYKIREENMSFNSFCQKVRCNTVKLFKKLR